MCAASVTVIEDRRNPTLPTRRGSGRKGGRRREDIPQDWVSPSEYAVRHSVGKTTVFKWIRQGLLTVYRAGSVVRIRNIPPQSS